MAHNNSIRNAVRVSYVIDQLSLAASAAKHGIGYSTAWYWKKVAKKWDDDWDIARAAQMITDGGIEDVVRQTLGVVVRQVQATVRAIQENPDMPPQVKVSMLASLANAYNKLISASKRLMPVTDKLEVATDVVKRLTEFIRIQHPKHASALLEVLEPFCDELAKAYG